MISSVLKIINGIVKLKGGTDNTIIGNVGDAIKVTTNNYEKLLPLLTNANWMKLADFDCIDPVFFENTATLFYKQNNAVIGKAIFTFVNDYNWNSKFERYINNTDGAILLNEDGFALNLS